jgi:hypothetical protein
MTGDIALVADAYKIILNKGNNMKTDSAISGLSVRHDVKTKCTIVQYFLTTKFSSQEQQKLAIEATATQLYVNPITIKLWINKFQHTYKQGLTLPKGVMSYSFNTIPNKKLAKVHSELQAIKNKLAKCKSKYHPTQTCKPTADLLDRLIL